MLPPTRLYPDMKAAHWVARLSVVGAFMAQGCQGSPDAQTGGVASAGTSAVGSAGNTATGGGTTTPPDFQPLGGPAAIACDATTKGLAGRRIWRLTRQQYESTVGALLGDASHPAAGFNPEPGSAQGFQNDAYSLRVRGAEAAQFQAAARTLAATAAKGDLARFTPCAATSLSDAACASDLVKALGRSAFRRPLSTAEQARYLELFQLGSAKRDATLGVEVLIEAMLQSPHFLYRFELGQAAGAGQVRLTEHELAALLSYTLVGGPPDAELAALADASMLSAPGNLAGQAGRLLAQPAARPAMWEFYRQLFEVTSLADAPKDASIFPEFDAARADLEASARAFVEHVLFDGDARLGSLLTSTQAFVNQGLSPFFGVGSGSALALTTLPGGEHPGILAHPAVLSVLAARTRSSPVNRGRFVRQKLLCDRIPDPPAGVDTQLPALDPGLTARQQLDQKTSGQPCTTCHSQMNPIGFGFEKLDGIGRFRATDNGQAIDDTGSLSGTRDIDGPFQGVGELSQKLASSAQVQECMSVQAYRYVFGRPETAADACAIAQARDRFAGAGLDLKELYLAIVATESFGSRKAD